MPEYLIQATYTAEGAKVLLSEGGTKRRDAAAKAIKSAGGKVEAFYFAFGKHDAIVLVDLPDNVCVAASLAINASGAVTTTTTVLLTPGEVDEAVKKSAPYRAPGQWGQILGVFSDPGEKTGQGRYHGQDCPGRSFGSSVPA